MKKFLLLPLLLLSLMASAASPVTITCVAGTVGNTNESYDKLCDGNTGTKWCHGFSDPTFFVFKPSRPCSIDAYTITTANDNATYSGRNPKTWVLLASNDSVQWDTLHAVTNDNVMQNKNFTPYTYTLSQASAVYTYFRWDIHAHQNGSSMQMSEFSLNILCDHLDLLEHRDATPATCIHGALPEHWYCTGCGHYFSDEAATQPLALGTPDPDAHHFVDGICSYCGIYEHSKWDTNLLLSPVASDSVAFRDWLWSDPNTTNACSFWRIAGEWYEGSLNDNMLYQVVDLRDMGFAAGVADGHQVYLQTRYINPAADYYYAGSCQALIIYEDSAHKSVKSEYILSHSYQNRDEDVMLAANFSTIPAGTRYIRFKLQGRAQHGRCSGGAGTPRFKDMMVVIKENAETTYSITVQQTSRLYINVSTPRAPEGYEVMLNSYSPNGSVFSHFTATPEVTWTSSRSFIMPAVPVTITPHIDSTLYVVTAVSADGYGLTSDHATAMAGDTIHLTRVFDHALYDNFKQSTSPSARWLNDSTFIMPASDLTVTASSLPRTVRVSYFHPIDGVTLSLEDTYYYWEPIPESYSSEGMVPGLMSNNKGVNYSDAVTTALITLTKPLRIAFSYRVSSESEDKLYIVLDGHTVVNGFAGTYSNDVTDSISLVLSQGEHRLTFRYTKSQYNAGRSDCAYVYNMRFQTLPGYALTVNPVEHVTIEAPDSGYVNAAVHLHATLDRGWMVEGFDCDSPLTWISDRDFLMPAYPVTLTPRVVAVSKSAISLPYSPAYTIQVPDSAYQADTVRLNMLTEGLAVFSCEASPEVRWLNDTTFLMPENNVSLTPVLKVTEYDMIGGSDYRSADNELYPNIFDGDTLTKWCTGISGYAYTHFTTFRPVRVSAYVITTANDNLTCTGRNPKTWELLASVNNSNWDTLQYVTNDQVLQDVNFTPYVFQLPAPTAKAYQYFRWKIYSNKGGTSMQVSEFTILPYFDESDTPTLIETIDTDSSAIKFYRDGQIYILRNGVIYDTLGRKVE